MKSPDQILSRAECKRRREALGWPYSRLDREALLPRGAIYRFETGRSQLNGPTWRTIILEALERGEAEFNRARDEARKERG